MWASIMRTNERIRARAMYGLSAVALSAVSTLVAAPLAPADTKSIDSWIDKSLRIMASNHIPGSRGGIYRNIMRESSGIPDAINAWDSNAQAGIPSKGLMQLIEPTFKKYHVPGTSWNIYDPIANITAACNYAASVYGTIDNVNSAY
ncbi:transglycosylase SLT domain-containing protein [Streptomyces sp. NPDC127084]|uniref:transglycosylase SLT domain-containing protein n=1 Tax=Streptomyces sp. NPDC127084 TaxID=3347133 RepID=UPI00365111F1